MSDATLTFPQTLVLRYGRFEPAERQQPQVVEDYTRWFLARLRAVEAAVAQSEYLCAGRFTAADVAVGYALLLAQHLGLAPQFGPATQAYWQRLQARPGYQRAMAAQLRAAVEQGVPTTPCARHAALNTRPTPPVFTERPACSNNSLASPHWPCRSPPQPSSHPRWWTCPRALA
jgi:hypothetical protein